MKNSLFWDKNWRAGEKGAIGGDVTSKIADESQPNKGKNGDDVGAGWGGCREDSRDGNGNDLGQISIRHRNGTRTGMGQRRRSASGGVPRPAGIQYTNGRKQGSGRQRMIGWISTNVTVILGTRFPSHQRRAVRK